MAAGIAPSLGTVNWGIQVAMGQIRHNQSGHVCTLEAETIVGRSPQAALHLAGSYVSAQHAAIRWIGQAWELKDLGSRNGTKVDEKPLEAGEAVRLEKGMKIAFGRSEQLWEVDDVAPPLPMLVPIGEPTNPLVIDSDVVALPSQDNPLATVYHAPDGSWNLEHEDALVKLVSGQIFEVGHRLWRLSCPTTLANTIEDPARASSELSGIALRFRVSADEEHVELSLKRKGEAADLGSRTHNYLLLLLARQRMADVDQGLTDAGCGWVYRDDLISQLRTDRERLNIDIFRIRKQFSAAGVADAAGIIERRPGSGQLRIGIRALEIVRL